MRSRWNWHPTIRERKDRKVNPYKSVLSVVLDDLEYTDYYKTNAPEHDGSAKKTTDKFISRMNKSNAS